MKVVTERRRRMGTYPMRTNEEKKMDAIPNEE